jgi:hypothetical protein
VPIGNQDIGQMDILKMELLKEVFGTMELWKELWVFKIIYMI